jgi:ATP-dependent exoDNAse (exonuclease V) alpha subunit
LVRAGTIPPKHEVSEGEIWLMKDTGTEENTQNQITDMVKAGGLDFQKDIILVCRNGERNDPDPCTVHGINKAIIDIIRPREDDCKWMVGDRIICHKNFSDLDIWNGTTGTITALEDNGRVAWVRGDIPFNDSTTGKPVLLDEIKWDRDVMNECQHAYALTVHKSQGSQYRRVVFAVFHRDMHMMSRSLSYTAITRTKEECRVMGSVSAFCKSISINDQKMTVIKELAEGVQNAG